MREHRASSIQRRNNLKGIRASLERVGAALAQDKVAWQAERGTYESVVRVLGSIERSAAAAPAAVAVPATPIAPAISSEPEPEIEVDARAFKPSTLLSIAGRATLDARKAALNSDHKDASRYEERLETAFSAFLEVVGDKALSYYLPIHMQDFATFLSRVPRNRSKIALFKWLTLKQTVDLNGKLPLDQRKPCLSETTVASYLSEVKNIWSQVSAGVMGLRDMGAYRVSMPKDAAASIDRQPLAAPSLNIWLRDAATPRLMNKPHKAWLPLAGLLTGMRLAELVYLQRTDIVDVEGNEVIDLTRPLSVGGKEIDLPVKTKTLKRYVAIHPLLHDTGFIEYAKSVTSPDGFVFGHFHSLRHSAKDWFREHAGERLADRSGGRGFLRVQRKTTVRSRRRMIILLDCGNAIELLPKIVFGE
ncbi:hypothetical protein [Shinella sp. G-2]|uniref:hypothetical protein n=1 Tax=Shinella sp. G-2 TaxID=3133141 RepID=UPI003D000A1D